MLRRLSISMIEAEFKALNSERTPFSRFNASVKRIKVTKAGFISQVVMIFTDEID